MNVEVNRDACISCGGCVAIAPEVFEFDDEGIACVVEKEINEEEHDNVIEAIENCPTEAIIEK